MALKSPEARKAYHAKYYLENREALLNADKIRHAAKRKGKPAFSFPSVGPGLNLHPERLKAEREGRKTWDPGFPCIHGHYAERATFGRMDCRQCNLEKHPTKTPKGKGFLRGKAWYDARGLPYADAEAKA